MAKAGKLINKFGKLSGWNSVTVNLLGRDVEGITELDYNDSLEKENVYGAGAYPIGRGEGKYEAKASITLLVEEARALQLALTPGSGMESIAAFPIVIEYEYNGMKVRDVVNNCEFMGNGVAVKQGDKTIAQKFDLIVSDITWNI